MAKTKPIGVRFDESLLVSLKEDGVAESPQKVLNFLTEFYRNRRDKIDLKPLFENSSLFKETNKEKEDVSKWRNDERIKELEKELANPPKTAIIGVRQWISIREKELAQLKANDK